MKRLIKNTSYMCLMLLCATVQAAADYKKALITGISGQDGSYLAEFLLEKGYEVHGIMRRASVPNNQRIEKIDDLIKKRGWKKMTLHYGDLTDSNSMATLIKDIQPDEIYNLAAQSHVGISFEIPEYTAQTDAVGVISMLKAIKDADLTQKTKFYQASTSELYGKVHEIPQSEITPFHPRSPYAVAKLCAYWATVNYREAYGIYACNGILFNHESPRRGEDFVTRKVTLALARIKHGLQDTLKMGNLDAKRDWGYAKDYVEGMWLMLQQENPQDFVLATGETHSVREFIEEACKHLGIEIVWQGKDVEEVGVDAKTGKVLVEIDPKYFRPAEVDYLLGNPTKAQKELNWTAKTTFKELVKIMIEADCALIESSIK